MATLKGGDKLEKALAKIAAQLATGDTVAVGFLENAKYPDGTPVAMVAAIQDFGAPKARIPPRPFFRNMIAAKSSQWPGAIAQQLKVNGYNANRALRTVGEGIRGQLQQSINDTVAPPLSPVTLMLRKMKSQNQALVVTRRTVGQAAARVKAGESTAGVSAKPLVETSFLINSVGVEVK